MHHVAHRNMTARFQSNHRVEPEYRRDNGCGKYVTIELITLCSPRKCTIARIELDDVRESRRASAKLLIVLVRSVSRIRRVDQIPSIKSRNPYAYNAFTCMIKPIVFNRAATAAGNGIADIVWPGAAIVSRIDLTGSYHHFCAVLVLNEREPGTLVIGTSEIRVCDCK